MKIAVPRSKGRRRLTCHHEGGHALVRWYFGHQTDRATVLTVEEVRAGKTITNRRGIEKQCEGAVDGYGIHNPPYVLPTFVGSPEDEARFQQLAMIARDIELMNCAAGIAAEAAYRHISSFACALYGGEGDLQSSSSILDAWYPDKDEQREAALLAERRATALVRSPSGSAAISAMADALMDRGEIDGDEIAAICRRAYGNRECPFGAWDSHWPPTLDQLRAGYIPSLEAQAA